MVSGTLSDPSSGCFSTFSRLTDSLSVVKEYLALEGGPPMFNSGFTGPDLLKGCGKSRNYRAFTFFGRAFQRVHITIAYPLSLAATYGVACCFPFLWVLRCFSSPRSLRRPMHSAADDPEGPGFPIQKSQDHSLIPAPLGLSQVSTSFIAS